MVAKKNSQSFKDDEDKLELIKRDDVSEESKDKFVRLKIEIIDSGVGIKKENIDKLFMEFGKLDEHSKVNAQGTGLGLSICKRMIE